MTKPFFIGIDGPSGAGKTTVAKCLATILRMDYIDTGAFYRALAYWFYKSTEKDNLLKYYEQDGTPIATTIALCLIDPHSAPKIDIKHDKNGNQIMIVNDIIIPDENLRTEKISKASSQISAIPAVREFLLEKQREAAKTRPAIMEGRDICTVVMPDADMKIFMNATPNIRAYRRHKQLQDIASKNEKSTQIPDIETIKNDLIERDNRDSNRKIAPLKPCVDSIMVNNNYNLHQTIKFILDNINTDAIKFINEFHNRIGEKTSAFRNGLCYHFAHMMKANFKRGEICWAAPFGHIVWKDNNGLVYDCEGFYNGEAEYIIPVDYIKEHIEDFTICTEKKSSGATKEYIQNAINRYKQDIGII